MTEYKKGDLSVWWIPQVPMKPFYYPVKTVKEAQLLLDVLGRYDQFQFENRIKPDYSNAGGLNVYSPEDADENGNCWVTWYNEDGSDIDECDENGETE